jgi:hypothetical protein
MIRDKYTANFRNSRSFLIIFNEFRMKVTFGHEDTVFVMGLK